MDQERKEEIVKRAMAAKDAGRFLRADRIFEFTGPQMEELSLALSALAVAFLAT